MKKLILILLISSLSLLSQINIPPQIQEVLDQVEKSLQGKIIETKLDFITNAMGMTTQFEIKAVIDLGSGKFYAEFGEMSTIVFDGKDTWSYSKLTNQYFKMPKGDNEFLIPINKEMLMKMFPKIENINMEETTFENKKSYLISFSGKDRKEMPIKVNLWIDSQNYLPLQYEFTTQFLEDKNPITMKYKIKNLVINPNISSDIFVFKPPKEAKEFKLPDSVTLEEKMEGKIAPDFTLQSLQGKKISLSSYRGKIVILDFWATWCPPCRQELKIIQKLYDEYKDKDVIILCINSGENREKVENFIDENNYTFTVLLDNDGKVSEMYKVKGIPRVLLIDKKGVIIKDITGYSPESEKLLKEEIEKIK